MWHHCGPVPKIRAAKTQMKMTHFTYTNYPHTLIMASLTLRESSSPTMSEQESSCCCALVSQSTQALWRCRKFSWSSMFFSECSTCSCHTRVDSCFLFLFLQLCTRHMTVVFYSVNFSSGTLLWSLFLPLEAWSSMDISMQHYAN